MMNIPCWQANKKCMVKGISRDDSHCPAYRANKSCYEFGWASFVKDAPPDVKKFWKVHMAKNCPKCNLYKVYRKDMDKAIAEVKKT